MGKWNFCSRVFGTFSCIRGAEDSDDSEIESRDHFPTAGKKEGHEPNAVQFIDTSDGIDKCKVCGDPNCMSYNKNLQGDLDAEHIAEEGNKTSVVLTHSPSGSRAMKSITGTTTAKLEFDASNFSSGMIAGSSYESNTNPHATMTSAICDEEVGRNCFTHSMRCLPSSTNTFKTSSVNSTEMALNVLEASGAENMTVVLPTFETDERLSVSDGNGFQGVHLNQEGPKKLLPAIGIGDGSAPGNDQPTSLAITDDTVTAMTQPGGPEKDENNEDGVQTLALCEHCSIKALALFGPFAAGNSIRTAYAEVVFRAAQAFLQTLGAMGKLQDGSAAPKHSSIAPTRMKVNKCAELENPLVNLHEDFRAIAAASHSHGLPRKPHEYHRLSMVINEIGRQASHLVTGASPSKQFPQLQVTPAGKITETRKEVNSDNEDVI